MWRDPMFWYTVAFVCFWALAFRYARKPFLGWLDGQIAGIREQLEAARRLRAEAEATLAEYKQKHAAAMAESIVRHAREEAARLKLRAEADLKAALTRHEQQAMERIRLAETEAVRAVRQAAITAAMMIAREKLAKGAADIRLIDRAIADMPHLARLKVRAA
jgi:F-type H+-transporting ATPase subunit b